MIFNVFITLFSTVLALYDMNSPVEKLTKDNFKELVL